MNPTPDDSNSTRRNWLCIAYAFAPINRSGTHRTLGFVRHLDRMGWDATVITVGAGGEPTDSSLNQLVPPSTKIFRTRWTDWHARGKRLISRRTPSGASFEALDNHTQTPLHSGSYDPSSNAAPSRLSGVRDWLSRWLITPDSRIGWTIPAYRAALHAIRQDRPEVIYSTSPYPTAHLIGLLLSRRTGIKWVADFRDPWRGNPFLVMPGGIHNRWDAWLERQVLERATRIICCTPTMTQALQRRKPSVAGKCTTILNAFDRERISNAQPLRCCSDDEFLMTHAGQFYGSRSPLPWFRALRRALDLQRTLRGKLRLALIGGDTYNGKPLKEWAIEYGVGHAVAVLGRLTHSETIGHLAGSDALVLGGSCGEGSALQVPGKLFEYVAMRKPIIATCSADSPVNEILRNSRALALVLHPQDVAGLADAVVRVASGRTPIPGDAWSGVQLLERAHRARELAEVFAQVTSTTVAAPQRIIKTRSAARDLQPPSIMSSPTKSASDDASLATSRRTSE
jgi:hypothetical protein